MNEQPFPKRALTICTRHLANYPPRTILFACAALQLLAASCFAFLYYSHNSFTWLDWAFVFSPVGYFFLGLVAGKKPQVSQNLGFLISGLSPVVPYASRPSASSDVLLNGLLLVIIIFFIFVIRRVVAARGQLRVLSLSQWIATAICVYVILLTSKAFIIINWYYIQITNGSLPAPIEDLRHLSIVLLISGFGFTAALFGLIRQRAQIAKSNALKKGKAANPTPSPDAIEPIK